MTCLVVVGTQYGDEGKGKITDFLAENSDYVVRYQGGNNAGHTLVINNEETILHFIPSGVFHNKKCVMGNGMVIDLDELKKEVEMLENKNVDVSNNLMISENAHIILKDDVESSKSDKIGSTGRGIAPAYANKYSKEGLRVRDILNVQEGLNDIDVKSRDKLIKFKDYLLKHKYLEKNIVNVSKVLNDAIRENKNILFEGAQGTGLDIDHGHYPYVTSSNASAGGVCSGTGIGPTKIDKVLGIAKAYVTRVDRDGESPLTTQLDDEVGKKLRDNGNEYGATTGRPRRCGWFDCVLVRHAIDVNGLSGLILTKLDVLDGFEEIKICTHYELNGKKIEEFPSDAISQRKCEPIYETLKGWEGSIKDCKNFDDLSLEAKNFVKKVEELLKIPVVMLSNGPKREEIIVREKIW